MRRMTIVLLLSVLAGRCWAAEAMVVDGNTLIVKGLTYRLDGVAAPQTDQVCLDDMGSTWGCGIAARDRLKNLVGKNDVECIGTKTDLAYRNRFIAVCTIKGEALSLDRWLVREGWALNYGPQAVRRFRVDQDLARDTQKGLWKGCFASPTALRGRNKRDAQFLGSACPKEVNGRLLSLLFPDNPVMPEGCSIKGKLAARAHITGHRGIYHIQSCGSYSRTKRPDRWFCSELEAQAEGFRKSLTCKL